MTPLMSFDIGSNLADVLIAIIIVFLVVAIIRLFRP